MTNDWTVTVKLKDLPDDADKESITLLLEALFYSNSDIPYEILKVEKAK